MNDEAKSMLRNSLAVKTYTETNGGATDRVSQSTTNLKALEKTSNVVSSTGNPSLKSPRDAKAPTTRSSVRASAVGSLKK